MSFSPTPACHMLRQMAEDGMSVFLISALADCTPQCRGYEICQKLAAPPVHREQALRWLVTTAMTLDPPPPTSAAPSLLSSAAALTHREVDVGRLIAEGCSNKIIAHKIGTSEHTVKVHVNSIFKKLGVHNRTQAARILSAQFLPHGNA